MKFGNTTEQELLQQADQLLYLVLWEPFGMPGDTRSKFEVAGKEETFVALDQDQVVGTIVLIIQAEAAEVRHAAVLAKYQRLGIGRELLNKVVTFAKSQGVKKLEVYARNSAIEFWEKGGFRDMSGWVDHEFFISHGIRFKKMIKKI